MRAEKPAWYLAVISGALLRTLDFVAARSAEYLGYLEKGQLPPARLTLTAFEEAFVLEGASAGRLALGHLWCSMNDESVLSLPLSGTPIRGSAGLSSCHDGQNPWQVACV